MLEKTLSSTEVSEKSVELNPRVSVVGLDLDNLVPGARWRGRYLIQEQSADITYGKVWSATEVETGRSVLVRSFRVNDELRERTWFSLTQYQGKGLVPLIESGEQEGRRVEVVGAAPGKTLASWAHGRVLTAAEIKPIVQQLATLLTTLHGLGVVLLQVNPHTVHIEEKADGLRMVLSGIESATDITRSSLVSVNVNPFYAPPEAAGLFQHHCGPTLRAWDWWSLGRVAQELALGKHVLSLVLGRDVTRHTPELLMRAEQFLKENNPEKSRAGCVEAMGQIDPALNHLLRGVLASNREGRWGAREIDAWLRGEKPKERYHLLRQERLFVWRDQVYSVVEAAEMFSSAELWDEGASQIQDQKTPGTLMNFLLDDVGGRKTSERVIELLKLPQGLAFGNCTAEAAREVVLGIVWAYLGNGHVPMRCRGSVVDQSWLTSRLRPESQPDGLARVQAIVEETAIKQIGLVCANSARLLSDFGHRAQGALQLAQGHHWISPSDAREVASLWAHALVPEEALRTILAEARRAYAISRDEALSNLFNRGSLDEIDLIALAYTLVEPARFGYVTHEVWSGELYSKLRDEGQRIAKAESWFNLGMQIRFGAHVVGPWPAFLLIWLITSASVALAYPSRATLALASAVFALGLMLRTVSKKLIQKELRRHDLMWDGILKFSGRSCDQNGVRCVPAMTSVSQRILHLRWVEINRQIAELRGTTAFAPLPPAAHFGFFKTVTILSGLAFLSVVGTLGYHTIKHPPTIPALKLAWFTPGRHSLERSTNTTTGKNLGNDDTSADADAKKTEDEAEQQGRKAHKHADDPNIVRQMSWTYSKISDAQHVTIIDEINATPEQIDAALQAGQAAAKPYRASTISGLLAVQVPMDGGIGLMLYDGQNAKVSDKHVFKIGYVPLARTWLQLGDHRAIYLGEN